MWSVKFYVLSSQEIITIRLLKYNEISDLYSLFECSPFISSYSLCMDCYININIGFSVSYTEREVSLDYQALGFSGTKRSLLVWSTEVSKVWEPSRMPLWCFWMQIDRKLFYLFVESNRSHRAIVHIKVKPKVISEMCWIRC